MTSFDLGLLKVVDGGIVGGWSMIQDGNIVIIGMDMGFQGSACNEKVDKATGAKTPALSYLHARISVPRLYTPSGFHWVMASSGQKYTNQS